MGRTDTRTDRRGAKPHLGAGWVDDDALDRRLTGTFEAVSAVAGTVSASVGALVLTGWAFHIRTLENVASGFATMKPNTAAAFLLGGGSMWLLGKDRGRVLRSVGRASALAILVLGAATLAEYVSGVDLRIDRSLLDLLTGGAAATDTGRMAAATAVGFLLVGGSLLLRASDRDRVADVVALGAIVISFVAIIGYAYGERSLYSIGWYSAMAVHTAGTLLILSFGGLFTHPDRGLTTIVTSDSAGGAIARRLLPMALVAPAMLGWLRLEGQRAGLYDAVFGLSIMVVSLVVAMTAVIWWTARSLHRSDVRRRAAEAALRSTHDDLKTRVEERTRELAFANESLRADIEERSRVQKALRRAESRFRSFVEFGPDAAVIVDGDGRVVLVNEQAELMFGYLREELIGSSMEILLPERFRAGHERDRVAYAEAPQARAMGAGRDLYGRRRDGSEFPVDISLSPLRTQDGDLFAAAIRDITERVEAETALRASEERFRLLSDAAFEGILIRDGDEILDGNRALASMFGYERDEIIGMDWHAIVAEESAAAVEEYARQGGGGPIEVTGRHKDGSTFPMLGRGTAAPFRGRPARIVALQDVSDLKEAERELRWALELERSAAERLRDVDAMKDTFLRAVSHDLRTPLAVILWLAQAIARGDPQLTPAETHEFLERIVANAKGLDRLVLDLLDLDRLSRDEVELARSPTDVGTLIRDAVERADLLSELHVHVETTPILADVDPVLVGRIVENLLTNAARHTPAGTDVWVDVQGEDDGVLITVEDSGPGVPREVREAIFEPFHQGQDARRNASGLGIGLSLVARFAHMHGGRAWVEDRPGGGASFRCSWGRGLTRSPPPANIRRR